MAACPAFNPLGAYVTDLVGMVDCHSLALGEEGWRALGSGSAFGTALTGLLAISVALLGYRTLLGETPSLRAGVSVAVRIGIVLALATQWAAYRPLIYDLATRGPDDLAGQVLAPGGLGGEDRVGLDGRVQAVSSALSALLHGAAADGPATTAPAAPPPSPPGDAVHAPRPAPDLPNDVLKSADTSNTVLLVSTLAGEVSVRVTLGLLLALGPLFAAGLLFEATQGWFVGWLRVVAGAALGAVAVPAVLALELAVLEPQVVALQGLLEAQSPLGGLPEQILATTALFAVVMLAALAAVMLAVAGLRLPTGLRARPWGRPTFAPTPAAAPTATPPTRSASAPAAERSRAQAIAEAARVAERRDAQFAGGGLRLLGAAGPAGGPALEAWASGAAARTQSERRARPRPSGGAARRDSQS